jgi:class 3 adenylate cyclase
MRCRKCSAENPPAAKFCIQCATPFGRRCANCTFENPAEARFCAQCATPLIGGDVGSPARTVDSQTRGVVLAADNPESQTIEGERKTVTALFADLKGSTELMAELDPEEARNIVDPALRIMVEAVRRYEGYVVQSMGDGIFALFGAPTAYEDHPQRALYAALQKPR